jgi:hypothetical protein
MKTASCHIATVQDEAQLDIPGRRLSAEESFHFSRLWRSTDSASPSDSVSPFIEYECYQFRTEALKV